MKYLTFLLSLLIALTFAFGQDTDKSSKCDKSESVEKECNKQNSCKHKCDESKKCKKESSCKHKCSKDNEKCEKNEMGKKKSECKKDSYIEHKCGEGKCGGDTKD